MTPEEHAERAEDRALLREWRKLYYPPATPARTVRRIPTMADQLASQRLGGKRGAHAGTIASVTLRARKKWGSTPMREPVKKGVE